MYYSLLSFNDSHFLTKAEEVFGFGELVETWKFKDRLVILYSYSNFFVEVCYDNESNSLTGIQAISASRASDKYVTYNELMTELVKV